MLWFDGIVDQRERGDEQPKQQRQRRRRSIASCSRWRRLGAAVARNLSGPLLGGSPIRYEWAERDRGVAHVGQQNRPGRLCCGAGRFIPTLPALGSTTYPECATTGRLLDHAINTQLIAEHWDELPRIAASIKHGHVTASLLVQRLQAHPNRSQLSLALQEYGRIIKTRFILRYHARPDERKAIRRQLNKHESMHALHDFLFYGTAPKPDRRR